MSNLKYQTLGIQLKTSNLMYPTLSIELKMSNVTYHTLSIETSNVERKASYFKYRNLK